MAPLSLQIIPKDDAARIALLRALPPEWGATTKLGDHALVRGITILGMKSSEGLDFYNYLITGLSTIPPAIAASLLYDILKTIAVRVFINGNETPAQSSDLAAAIEKTRDNL